MAWRLLTALAFAGALLSAAPAAAAAAEWRVQEEASTIEFDYVINGAPSVGTFPRFEGAGSFDPASPEASSLRLVIDTGALDLGWLVASLFARGAGWFDAEAHPAAVFQLDRVTILPDGTWTAEGALEMRGISRPLVATLTLDLRDGRARAVGETTIDRTEYGIGRGPTAVLVEVSEAIRVRFDLVAAPVAPN